MDVINLDGILGSGIDRVLDVVKGGGVVCFPTDTVYGLGVDPNNAAAVDRLFRIKKRLPDKPILLLVDSLEMAFEQSKETPFFKEIAAEFWPGPITVIVFAEPHLCKALTGGGGNVGIRLPVAPLATHLISRLGHPLTATSANLSGSVPARSVADVIDQLGSSVDVIIDGGMAKSGQASTLLDLTIDPPEMLREGPVSFQTVRAFMDGRLEKHFK